MRNFKIYINGLGVLMFGLTFMTTQAQNTDEILQSFYKKVSSGDIDNWKKIKSVYFEEETYYDDPEQLNFMATPGTSFHKIYKQWPDKYVNRLYQDSVLVSVYYRIKNSAYYVLGNMPPQKISPSAYSHGFEFEPMMVYQTIRQSRSVKFQGFRDFDTGKCYHLTAEKKDLVWHFYFNTETNLLDYWSNSPDGLEFSVTKICNYLAFEDPLIPMSEAKFKNGVIFYSGTRKNIKLNAEIDPAIFEVK